MLNLENYHWKKKKKNTINNKEIEIVTKLKNKIKDNTSGCVKCDNAELIP